MLPRSFRGGPVPALRRTLAAAALLFSVALTGCVRTHPVQQVIQTSQVLDATLEQLLEQLDTQDKAVQTMFATVEITASTGGGREGKIKEEPTLSGYIFLSRPNDFRVLMQAPILRSRLLDMASDGTTFKLIVTPPGKTAKAYTGLDRYTVASKNGLENIRPYVIRDALLIPTAGPEEYVSRVEGSRVLQQTVKKAIVEEPDYDVTISRVKSGHVLERVRVIHFGRTTLRPYQQDIYDHEGNIVTTVTYDKYQKFGDLQYPTSMVITRPLDELTLKIDFTKLALNGKLDPLQFELNFPEGIVPQDMDKLKPAPAAAATPSAH